MHDPRELERLGFMVSRGGAHTARTIMLDELIRLFDKVPADAFTDTYAEAIQDQNCLGKRSGRSRKLTFRHLTVLYALDPSNPIHAGLRYYWHRDDQGRPLLALLAASARDGLLKAMIPTILAAPPGAIVTRDAIENAIAARWPGRFSPATLKSAAQNINSSLTKSGHLKGRIKKVRELVQPTIGGVAYALYLGWLRGERGQLLLSSEFCKMLDCPPERIAELAAQASAKGWMVFRHIGDVIDVDFPMVVSLNSAVAPGRKGP